MKKIKREFDKIEWDNKSAGMRVKRFSQAGKQLRLIEITPESGEAEWCDEGHVGYILEGTLETNVNGTIERLSAGDGLIIPDGQEYRHKSRAVDGIVRLLLVDDTLS
jgi:quercetin dioxygenase-like cupin family protein